MGKHIQQFNRQSFRVASESPCQHGLLHDALTFTSLSPSSLEILEKSQWPEERPADRPLLGEFLALFAIPDNVKTVDPPKISTVLTEEDVSYGFKSWKESTSTSLSGRHLGHNKTMIQDPVLRLTLTTTFLNLAVGRGISVKRWHKATSVLLEKNPGLPCIHRLRIIHLFEADFNLFQKMVWGSRLVKRACQKIF